MAKIIGYEKIQKHPDKNEIVQKLTEGEPTRVISDWLKAKYPYQKEYRVSFNALQSYRKNYLNLEADVLKDVQEKRKLLQLERREIQRKEEAKQLPQYQAGINNYVQTSLIDYNQEILNLLREAREGIESLKDLNENKGTHLNHQAIATYLSQYKSVIEMHAKLVSDQEKKAGDTLEADHQLLQDRMEILISSVKEVFMEMYPEGLTIFLTNNREKM